MELAPTIAIAVFILCGTSVAGDFNGLRVGFYDATCPRAEMIIRQTVREAIHRNPGDAPGLIRLHFHDCFVRGCDASVLLTSTPSGEPVEMASPSNYGLRGLELIDLAKARLEAECPNTVSCADLLAFATRDAAVFARIPPYDVPAGRRDGSVSSAREASQNLPVPFSQDVRRMIQMFEWKGLNTLDLVTLLGSHSIGRLHCKFVVKNGSGVIPYAQELGMDPEYAEHLRRECPAVQGEDAVVPLNTKESNSRILSNDFYDNLAEGRVALMSDQALMNDPETRMMVVEMDKSTHLWKMRYRASMVKMGTIQVLTGSQGQIRASCGVVNR